MSLVVFVTVLGLFAPIIIAAVVAYTFNKYNAVKSIIIGFTADVVVIAAFASWTANNWTIYDGEVGGAIWVPIALVWVICSLVVFVVVDALTLDEIAARKATEEPTL